MSRTNYIYIDYENVREVDLDLIAEKPVKVILAVGPQVKNLPLRLVEQALKYASQLRILKSVRTGKNSLDLLIASDLGKERERDPKGFFHIFSKDTGFDSLVTNLRAQGALVERRESLGAIPVLMKAEERLTLLKERLGSLKTGHPKSRASWEKYVQAQFNQSLTEAEVSLAVNGLAQAKVFTMDAGGAFIHPGGSPKSTLPVQKDKGGPIPANVQPAPLTKQIPLPGLEERVKKVREGLARVPKSRPAKLSALRGFINGVLHHTVPDGAMGKTIKALEAENVLTLDATGKVVYLDGPPSGSEGWLPL